MGRSWGSAGVWWGEGLLLAAAFLVAVAPAPGEYSISIYLFLLTCFIWLIFIYFSIIFGFLSLFSCTFLVYVLLPRADVRGWGSSFHLFGLFFALSFFPFPMLFIWVAFATAVSEYHVMLCYEVPWFGSHVKPLVQQTYKTKMGLSLRRRELCLNWASPPTKSHTILTYCKDTINIESLFPTNMSLNVL